MPKTPKPKPRKPAVRENLSPERRKHLAYVADVKLARKIAADLFTNGNGDKGIHLALTDGANRYLGGWSEPAVIGQLRKLLAAARKGKS